ncbi:hypothetical protein HanIR_Chr06g0272841 [Helianthus annuus]|nr:hypothetical protein HanIR_Chr06g0272841 [Helianthus annuus]
MMKLRNHQPSSQLYELIPDPLRTRKSSGMFVKGSYPAKTKARGHATRDLSDNLVL